MNVVIVLPRMSSEAGVAMDITLSPIASCCAAPVRACHCPAGSCPAAQCRGSEAPQPSRANCAPPAHNGIGPEVISKQVSGRPGASGAGPAVVPGQDLAEVYRAGTRWCDEI